MGASNAGAMAGGIDRVHSKCAARLPLQRDLVSDGIGAMCRVDSPPAQRRNEACAVLGCPTFLREQECISSNDVRGGVPYGRIWL